MRKNRTSRLKNVANIYAFCIFKHSAFCIRFCMSGTVPTRMYIRTPCFQDKWTWLARASYENKWIYRWIYQKTKQKPQHFPGKCDRSHMSQTFFHWKYWSRRTTKKENNNKNIYPSVFLPCYQAFPRSLLTLATKNTIFGKGNLI